MSMDFTYDSAGCYTIRQGKFTKHAPPLQKLGSLAPGNVAAVTSDENVLYN